MELMNILLVFLLLLPVTLLAQDYSVLNHEKQCWCKKYNKANKSFTNVDPKKFYKLRLHAVPHKKDERYSVFKYSGDMYVVLSKCLDPVNVATDDFDSLIDSEPSDDDKYINAVTKSPTFSEGLRFDENKYFLELNFGSASVPDQNQIFPYDELNGRLEDSGGNPITISNPKKSKYKAGGLINLGFGRRWSDNSFLSFKLKYFSGKKEEVVTGTSIMGSGDIPFNYKDKFWSFLVGNKWIFLESSHLKPMIGLYVGITSATSEITIGDQPALKFESTGLEALAEAGLEWMWNQNFGIAVTGGYDFIGTKKWKLKGKDEDDGSSDQFTSKMSYSNVFVTGGIRVYFN
jgi:hypothetical protein